MKDKEIEFKDFGMGIIKNALPAYLDILNGYVPGLLFTLIADKRLVSLFGPQDRSTTRAQKIFWMSDHDAIFDNADVFAVFQNVLGFYTAKKFGRLGGARPFNERSTDFLDLLSAADIAAGSVAQYFTGRDDVGEQNVCVKEGAEKVLKWFGHDGLGLKKLCVIMCPGDNTPILSCTVEFAPKEMSENGTYLPIHLCR